MRTGWKGDSVAKGKMQVFGEGETTSTHGKNKHMAVEPCSAASDLERG